MRNCYARKGRKCKYCNGGLGLGFCCQHVIAHAYLHKTGFLTDETHNFERQMHNFEIGGFYAFLLLRHKNTAFSSRPILICLGEFPYTYYSTVWEKKEKIFLEFSTPVTQAKTILQNN